MRRLLLALLLVVAGGITGALVMAAHAVHVVLIANAKADYYLTVSHKMATEVEQCRFAQRKRAWP